MSKQRIVMPMKYVIIKCNKCADVSCELFIKKADDDFDDRMTQRLIDDSSVHKY